MKYLLLMILIIPNLLFSAKTVNCIGTITATNTNNLPFIYSSMEYYEIHSPDLVEGNLDTVNGTIVYYSNESAICGGAKNENILIEASCSSNLDACWDVKVGMKGTNIIEVDETGTFSNSVIVVDGDYPCLPTETGTFTLGLHSASNKIDYEPPFAHANLTQFNIDGTEYLSQSVADDYRSLCSDLPPNTSNPAQDYHPELKILIDNTSEIKKANDKSDDLDSSLESFVNTTKDNTESSDISDLDTFQTNYETTLDSSFSKYSDIFGFGGYGSAPAPIVFTFRGASYEVFNITLISGYLDLIRNIFSIFAYFWGIIIVFRGV